MLGYMVLILIVGCGFVFVLFVEMRKAETPVLTAILKWQSFLGALVGLIVVAFSVQLTATENRSQISDEREIRGRQTVLALHSEVTSLIKEIGKLGVSASTGADVAKKQKVRLDQLKIGKYTLTCPGGKELIRVVRPMGVFEANKANLGLLPGRLPYQFVSLHDAWRQLVESIERLPKTIDCTSGDRYDLTEIEILTRIVLEEMTQINLEMKRLGFHLTDYQ